MQEKSALKLHFLHRTDRLAEKLRMNVQDLPDLMKVSRRTLFACRSNESLVTKRTLRALETAERAAGIAPESEPEPTPQSRLDPELPAETPEDRTERLEKKIDRLEGMMEEMLRCMKEHKKI